MKIKTRLAIAFITITVVPIVLIYIAVMGLVNYQGRSFQKNYGLNEQIDLLSGNSMQVFNRTARHITSRQAYRPSAEFHAGIQPSDTGSLQYNPEGSG